MALSVLANIPLDEASLSTKLLSIKQKQKRHMLSYRNMPREEEELEIQGTQPRADRPSWILDCRSPGRFGLAGFPVL